MLKQSFQDLIRCVRAGENDAAEELVRSYEPEVRRVIRVWLTDPRLKPVLDSVDICQSVLANFFVRVAAGQFKLEHPQQLLNLLVTMARHKLLDVVRRLHSKGRDCRRLVSGEEVLETVTDTRVSPSELVARQELLQLLLQKLSPQERQLAEHRALGRNWAEIGTLVGLKPDTARLQLDRAIDRVARELRLDEVEHG